MIKYKHAGNDHFVRFSTDENGNILPDTKTAAFGPNDKSGMGAAFYQEYLKHVELGGEVEPQYTAEEQAAKDSKEATQALESQFSTCKQLLDETQYIVSGDCDFPQADIDKYLAWRIDIKTIMRSGIKQVIPEKPF